MQKDKLFYSQDQGNAGGEVGIEKVLQMVSQTHLAQRRQEVNPQIFGKVLKVYLGVHFLRSLRNTSKLASLVYLCFPRFTRK